MSTRPTPVSNKAKIAFTSLFANDDAYWVPFTVACNLERGRDEALALLASEKSTRNTIVKRAAETQRELAIWEHFATQFSTEREHNAMQALAYKSERDEVRGQRDRLAEALRECRDDSIELLGERDWWQRESRGDYQERYQEIRDNVTRADAALQSLNNNPSAESRPS